MKLLFCTECNDLFSLDMTLKQCKCGKVKGRYTDRKYAETNGEGISIGLSNHSLVDAIRNPGKRITLEAWSRPHEGKLNPHSKVNRGL